MPSFHDSTVSGAQPEDVWKLLYDPSRFPDWWAGIETVDVTGDGEYTMYPDGYPDFPMAQLLDTRRADQRVTVSCLVSDLRFEWRLEPAGEGTRITVDVEIPEAEAHRLETQRDVIRTSMRQLAELAAEHSGRSTSAGLGITLARQIRRPGLGRRLVFGVQCLARDRRGFAADPKSAPFWIGCSMTRARVEVRHSSSAVTRESARPL